MKFEISFSGFTLYSMEETNQQKKQKKNLSTKQISLETDSADPKK